MPATKEKDSKDELEYLREILKYLKRLTDLVESKFEYIDSALSELSSRVDKLSRRVEELEKRLNKVSVSASKRATKKSVTESESEQELVRYVRENVFVETKEIKSKKLLKRLVDKGELIVLRDDVLNLEIVTTPDVIRRILSKLPLESDRVVEELSEREYELLKILNRLGYVLVRDNRYVKTELAKELLGGEEEE